MRILQVIPLYDSYRVFLRYLASALVAQGHEVLTVCDCQQRLLPFAMDHEFPLRHLDFPRGADPWQQWRAARRLRDVIRQSALGIGFGCHDRFHDAPPSPPNASASCAHHGRCRPIPSLPHFTH